MQGQVGWQRAAEAEVPPHVLEVPEVADDGGHWVAEVDVLEVEKVEEVAVGWPRAAEVHPHVLEVPEVADNSWYRVLDVLDVLDGGEVAGWHQADEAQPQNMLEEEPPAGNTGALDMIDHMGPSLVDSNNAVDHGLQHLENNLVHPAVDVVG